MPYTWPATASDFRCPARAGQLKNNNEGENQIEPFPSICYIQTHE